MDDEAAIRLFVADGGLAHEWHAQDPCTMNHYRKAAGKLVPAHGFEPQYPEPNSGVLPLDEAGEVGTGPRI